MDDLNAGRGVGPRWPVFEALYRGLCETQSGDTVSFTDWRGDPEERLVDGQTLADGSGATSRRGVEVRARLAIPSQFTAATWSTTWS